MLAGRRQNRKFKPGISPSARTERDCQPDKEPPRKARRFLPRNAPYATTVWDYINRGMPRNQGGSLSANEVYSLTAFILAKSEIIQEGDVMDAKTLPQVQMPNRNGFIPQRFADIPDERKRGCSQGACP